MKTIQSLSLLSLMLSIFSLMGIGSGHAAAGDTASTPNTRTEKQTPPPLSVTATSDTAVALNGQTVLFTAVATGGTPPYTYNWTFQVDNGPLTPISEGPTQSNTDIETATAAIPPGQPPSTGGDSLTGIVTVTDNGTPTPQTATGQVVVPIASPAPTPTPPPQEPLNPPGSGTVTQGPATKAINETGAAGIGPEDGADFTYTLKDAAGNPIKNAKISESVKETVTVTDPNNNNANVVLPIPIAGGQNNIATTDPNGNFTDSVVGQTPHDLYQEAAGNANNTTVVTENIDKTYTAVAPDGTTTTFEVIQTVPITVVTGATGGSFDPSKSSISVGTPTSSFPAPASPTPTP